MAAHVIVKLLAVLLFFLLDVVQRVARAGVGKFKDAGVIHGRDMFFGVQRVADQVLVVLAHLAIALAAAGGTALLILLLLLIPAAHHRDRALHQRLDGLKMLDRGSFQRAV